MILKLKYPTSCYVISYKCSVTGWLFFSMYAHNNNDVVAKKQLEGVLPRVGVLHHFTLLKLRGDAIHLENETVPHIKHFGVNHSLTSMMTTSPYVCVKSCRYHLPISIFTTRALIAPSSFSRDRRIKIKKSSSSRTVELFENAQHIFCMLFSN